MAFAGLWEIWRDPSVADDDDPDAWVRSCVIVTTRANELLEPIHDRMPVVLAETAGTRGSIPRPTTSARSSDAAARRPTSGSRCTR